MPDLLPGNEDPPPKKARAKVDWQKVKGDALAKWPAQPALLLDKGVPGEMLEYWAIISRELRELPLTKAERAIFQNIISRAGLTSHCSASVATLARETRTHPDYTRWTIRRLIRRGLVIRRAVPGHANILVPANKLAWLQDRKPTDIGLPTGPEETAAEAARMELWEKTLDLMPDAPKALMDSRMTEYRRKYERVLADVAQRVKRGQPGRADGLPEVKDVRALFEDTWGRFK
jgi:hypothetical protein